MKIEFIVFSKHDSGFITEGINLYTERINRYVQFSSKIITEPKNHGKNPIDIQKSIESQLFLNNINPQDEIVLLDENGKTMSSEEFAGFINQRFLTGKKKLVFIVGGPYGFDKSMYNRADHKISLSPMTFSHQLVRLVFLEQLYRGLTILKGEPYHHK